MNIAIIDADLIGRKRHRFPNLACMKISGYWKEVENTTVCLKMNYENLQDYDKVYISKVFTDTEVPGEPENKTGKNYDTICEWYKNNEFLKQPNIEYGGTGFFFDEAPNLPDEIEHHYPDYHLYDDWINEQISNGIKRLEFKEYLDYSIGFLTRGCFRKCKFCVNQKYDKVVAHSPLEEFYNPTRRKICLLDDNFFGCPDWEKLLLDLKETGKPFKFKQGMDERILTDEKCELLFSCKYDSDPYFAFDDVDDYELIEKKLNLIRKHTDKQLVFYVLVGFDKTGNYDDEFWYNDIVNMFKRIELLMKYKCLPYIMRFNGWDNSPYRGLYINAARWCNQPSFYKKKSMEEYCHMDCHIGKATQRYYLEFLEKHPEFNKKYMTMKF